MLEVEKRLKLKEELRSCTSNEEDEDEVRETVRRERVELEDATANGVVIVDRRKGRDSDSPGAVLTAQAGALPAPIPTSTRKATPYGALGTTADTPPGTPKRAGRPAHPPS